MAQWMTGTAGRRQRGAYAAVRNRNQARFDVRVISPRYGNSLHPATGSSANYAREFRCVALLLSGSCWMKARRGIRHVGF
jgi:hypothetical protein